MSDAFYEGVAIWSQVVASLLFLAVLVYLWVRFIAPAVVASQLRKNAELFDAEKRRDEARDRASVAATEIANAEADAKAILARAQGDASRLHDRIVSEARAEGERLARNAGGELERSRAVARGELRAELLERALGIARERAATIDPATDRRLVDEALETAEAGAHS
jgi:F0F1-type ATP synthase membrane subunit b/b'